MDDSVTARELAVGVAERGEVPAIKTMVDSAYSKYISRLGGKVPAPMLVDYGAMVDGGHVHVLRLGGRPVGSIVLAMEGDAVTIDDLVVDPSMQGRGYGRRLLQFALDLAHEKQATGLTLFTNEKMHENIAMYAKMGFREVERKSQDGYDRVFFRKDV